MLKFFHVKSFLCLLFAVFLFSKVASAQVTTTDDVVTEGIYNWVHSSGDAELAFSFYQRVFDFELAHSTFAPLTGEESSPPVIRSVAEAGSDALVWDLTNTHGSRFRTVFMHAKNMSYGLELSEFFDISRLDRPANPWDLGSSSLIFHVRDFNDVVSRLHDFGSPIVTLGGNPLETSAGKTLLVRDPDGYLIQIIQASAEEIAQASDGVVIKGDIRITVSNISNVHDFYGDLLGFNTNQQARVNEIEIFGLDKGGVTETHSIIPGTDVEVIFTEFALADDIEFPAYDYNWQLQDVGSPQFQLQVKGLDALLKKTESAGYRFLSVEGQPIQRPFGRFVFAIDQDGVLVEFVEPSRP